MDLIVHVSRQIVLATKQSAQALSELSISQRNKFPLGVIFVDDGPSATEPIITVPIPAPYTRILISARPNDALDEANLLFFSDTFVAQGADDTLKYVGDLNSLTAPTAALFADSQTRGRYACLLDIDLLVSADPDDGRLTLIKHRPFWLYRTLWQGDEGVPLTDVPTYPAPSAIELVERKGEANGYAGLDANGKVPTAQLPDSAITEAVTVADETARFALTTAEVQLGDFVLQTDTSVLYQVTDTANLDSAAGYTALATVAWSAVTGKPSTFAPSAHTHPAADISDSSAAGRTILTAADLAAQQAALQIIPSTGGTFTGPVGVANPVSGGQAVNRDYMDARCLTLKTLMEGLVWMVNYDSPAITALAAVSGSGSVGNRGTKYLTLNSGGTAGSTAIQRLISYSFGWPGGVGDKIDWSEPFRVSLMLCNHTKTTNGVFRLKVGCSYTNAIGDLAQLGIGFNITGATSDNFIGTAYGASGLQTVTLGTIGTAVQPNENIEIVSDGAGNVTWYRGGVSVGTTSLGPTGNVGSSLGAQLEITNGADAATIRVEAGRMVIIAG